MLVRMGTRRRLVVLLALATWTLGSSAAAQPNAKPPTTSQPAPAKPSASKPAHKAGTKPARTPENGIRRQVAGGPTLDDTQIGADTPELRALYAAERELFPPASPAV